MTRHFFSVGLACACLLSLPSCNRVGEGPEARINAALPPAADIAESKAKYEALEQDAAARASLQKEFDARLKVRAIECAKGYEPSVFASEESIRGALTDKPCFEQADRKLAAWLGQRRIAGLLAAPPLRPIPAKPVAAFGVGSFINGVQFAERAGVALLETELGKVATLVDLADNKVVVRREGKQPRSISPNGRLWLVSGGERSSELRSVEDDALLATYPEVDPWEFHWVGDVGAIYLRTGKDRSKQPVFVDFATGTESVLPLGAHALYRVLPRPGGDKHYLVVGHDRIGEFVLERDGQAWQARLLSETALAESGYWSYDAIGLNANGKLMFNGREKLYLFELDTLRKQNLSLMPMHPQSAIATADADKLLLSGMFTNSTRGHETFEFSVSQRTLAPLDRSRLSSTRLLYIPSLRRNAVINQKQVELLEALPVGEAMPMAAYLEQRDAEGRAYAASNPGMFNERGYQDLNYRRAPTGNSNLTVAQMLVQSQREGASSGFVDSVRRSRNIDDATWAEAERAVRGENNRLAAQVGATGVLPGPIAEIGKTAQVEGIGIYEAQHADRKMGPQGRMGYVHVTVRRSAKPLVLALTSYESVQWIITLDPGANLAAVLVSGYKQSEVFGAGNAKVVQIGSQHYAYSRDSNEYHRWNAEVARLTGKPVGNFQGSYRGNTFFVGR